MNFQRITSAILSTALIGTSFNVRADENEVAVASKTTKSTTIRKTSQLPKRKRQAKRSNAPQKKQTNIEALWGTLKPLQQNLILYGILPASAMIGIYELYNHFPSGGLPAEFNGFDWPQFVTTVHAYVRIRNTVAEREIPWYVRDDFEHHIQEFNNTENSFFDLEGFQRAKIIRRDVSRYELDRWVQDVNNLIEQEARRREEERRREEARRREEEWRGEEEWRRFEEARRRIEEARRRFEEARRREGAAARRRRVEITRHDLGFDDFNWQDFSIIVGEYARFKSTATPDQLPGYIERLYHTYMEEFVSAPDYTFDHDAFVTNKINRNIIQETNMANDPISARMAIDTWRAQVFEFLLNQGAAQDRERGDLNAEGSGIDFPGIREIMSQFAAINSDLVGDGDLRQIMLELPNGVQDWEIFTLIRNRLQATLIERNHPHIATDSEIQSTLSHYAPEVINAWTAKMKTFLNDNVPREWFRLKPEAETINASLQSLNFGTDETPVHLKFGVPLVCANKLSAWRRVEVNDSELTEANLGPKIQELAGSETMGDLLTSFGRPICDHWVGHTNVTFYDYVFNYTGWHLGGRFGELLEHDRESLRDLARLFKAYDRLSPIGKLAFKEQFRAIASGANNMCKNELAQIIAQLCMKMDTMMPGGIPIGDPHALLNLAMTSAKLSSLKTASDTTMQRLEDGAFAAEFQRGLYSRAANIFGLSVAGTSEYGEDTANLILSGDPNRTETDQGANEAVTGQQLLKDFNTLFFNDFISEFMKSANLTLGGLDTEIAGTFAKEMSKNPISFRDLEALLSLPMVKDFLRERRNNWIPADVRDGVCNALDNVSLRDRLTALADALDGVDDDDDGVENAENPAARISTKQNLLNYINYVDDASTPTSIHSIADIAILMAENVPFIHGNEINNIPEFAGGKYTAAIAPLIALHGMGAISVVHQ